MTDEEKYQKLLDEFGDEMVGDALQALYDSGVPYIDQDDIPKYADDLLNIIKERGNQIRVTHK